jgi:integrase
MQYKVYPFFRADRYWLYVVFYDENGGRVVKSLRVSYPKRHTKEVAQQAHDKAHPVAKRIVRNHYKTFKEDSLAFRSSFKLSKFFEQVYIPYLTTNRRKGSVVRMQKSMQRWIEEVGDLPLKRYTYEQMERYKQHRMETAKITKSTADVELRSVKTVFMKAHKWGYLMRSPYMGEDMLFKEPSTRRAFTNQEYEQLIHAAKGTVAELLIKFAYLTGMRAGEICTLTWGMVNRESRSVELPAHLTKGNRRRTVPLSVKALEVLDQCYELLLLKRLKHPNFYKDLPDCECPVFQKERGWGRFRVSGLDTLFKKAREKAGISKELKFHCLRHTMATRSLERGAEMHKVSKILGHTTIVITQKFYDHTCVLQYRDVLEML